MKVIKIKQGTKKRFVWQIGDTGFADCITCKHKLSYGSFCLAFPDGIPDTILSGEIDHKKPYKGDHGIQYEPIKQ